MKKFFTLLLTMMVSIYALYAESGTCGNNLTWNLTDSVLTISGTGGMNRYNDYYSDRAPWYQYRESISSVIITNGVTKIGNYAFYDCFHVTMVEFPESLREIGDRAFAACYSLTSVTIPNSVSYIGLYAFNWVPNIVYSGSVTWQQSNPRWGARSINGVVDGYWVYSDISKNTLIACSAVAKGNITIPNTVVSIHNYAFHRCSDIISVKIPNSVHQIGLGAFEFCAKLSSITIPATVTSIGSYCFDECTSLQLVYNYSITPQFITSNVFDDVNISACTLYVPEQSILLYTYDSVWGDFIIETIPLSGGIDNVFQDVRPCTKRLQDGQIVIHKDDKSYTVGGIEIH